MAARGTAKLLVLSQVVLSMQLPFAVIPLVRFVSDRKLMGKLAISRPLAALAWAIAALIVGLNAKLLVRHFHRGPLRSGFGPLLTTRCCRHIGTQIRKAGLMRSGKFG